jgi:hypothetical protein
MYSTGGMTIFRDLDTPPPSATRPADVDLILSALDAGHFSPAAAERRALKRHKYRVEGWLRLFTDGPDDSARLVYTRDVNARGLGFITSHRLPLGYGGLIQLPRPDGDGTMTVHCTILRCREAAPGWFEGSIYFNREQPSLVPDHQPKQRRTLALAV